VLRDQVAITGIGIVSALGFSPEETWLAMENGHTGLGPLTLFRSPRCGHVPVAEVKGDLALHSGLSSGSRTDHLAVYAARSAFRSAGLESLSRENREEVGIVLGICTGGILDTEVFLEKLLKENLADMQLVRHHECASPVDSIARSLGLNGFRTTVSTACSSGATALVTACDLLESGESEIVLAGGADSLARLTLNGFCSLLIVASDGCRPFDAERGGMSLGEGAGVFVLEKRETAVARGAHILGYIAGAGSTCDAHHATGPVPDGSGILQAMSLALHAAGMSPSDVDYINAHGTGTLDNDVSEAKAIMRLFDGNPPLVSSTKRFFGHTLAAAGAIEAAVCVLALNHQHAPANLGLRRADPEIGFTPVEQMRQAQLRVAMSNSMGFGGVNCSLIICGPQEEKA